MSNPKSRFASQTLFSALAIDAGDEESEEEQVEEAPEPISEPEVPTPAPQKLSKTAMKKAAKAAKEAKLKARIESQQIRNGETTKEAIENGKKLNGDVSSSISTPVLAEARLEPTSEHVAPVVEEVPHDATPSHPEPKAAPIPVPTPAAPEKEPEPAKVEEETSKRPVEVATKVPESVAPVTNPEPQRVETETTKPVVQIVAPPNDEKKKQNIITRTLTTLIMIGGFLGLLSLGHVYMIILVMVCQAIVYREVTALFSLKAPSQTGEKRGGKDPWSKALNWYFFAVTNYFLYGESIIYYFKHVIFSDVQLHAFATNHRIISFTLYTIGFVGFVASLKKGYLKQQFGLFCWVHMSLLLIVVSSHFIVNNILEGLIWFFVPASLVICNDIFAYICGITLGRTPLIKLSPKKTVEGFVGAFWCTLLFSVGWGAFFMRSKYMICPVHDLGVTFWSNVQCVPNPVFVWKEWIIPEPITALVSSTLGYSITTIPYVPYFGHLLVMSSFASLVAPFGGFFASGFKRAFNIKDFGHSIPGHGGMTDRMDCQFLMGVFTYVYYSSLIRQHTVTVGSVLQTVVRGLTVDEQLELISDLRRYLEGMGVQASC